MPHASSSDFQQRALHLLHLNLKSHQITYTLKLLVYLTQVYSKSFYFVLTSADWDLFVQPRQVLLKQPYLPACFVQQSAIHENKDKKSPFMTLGCFCFYIDSHRPTHTRTQTQTQLWLEGIHDNRVLQTSGTHTQSLCHDLYGKDKDIGDKSQSAIQ